MIDIIYTVKASHLKDSNSYKIQQESYWRLKYWVIIQATPKCQIDFWAKLAKKGLK